MKTYKAILIDPIAREVSEVLIPSTGTLEAIYKFLDCRCFTIAAHLENQDAIFVDDEGLLKDPEHFFVTTHYPQPLAGKALIMGTDDEGETKDVGTAPTFDVLWLNRNEIRLFMESEQKIVDKMRKHGPKNAIYTTMKEALE